MTSNLGTNFPAHLSGQKVDYAAVKRAFAHYGYLFIDVNDARLDAFERQFLRNVGLKLYGPGEGR